VQQSFEERGRLVVGEEKEGMSGLRGRREDGEWWVGFGWFGFDGEVFVL
jgi:hypothetical protein